MSSADMKDRGRWGSKIAFIFAASGSAIGLGNIWRFPIMVGLNGGAIFVLSYIVAVFFIGFTIMLAELTIGRHTQKNPVGAFEAIRPRTPWKLAGYLELLPASASFLIIQLWLAGRWAISTRPRPESSGVRSPGSFPRGFLPGLWPAR